MVTEMGSTAVGGISPALSANAAKSFLEATDKEKKEMQSLNDRLANYIDRVKNLEVSLLTYYEIMIWLKCEYGRNKLFQEQNRKLVADLEDLRGRWGKDTSEIKVRI